MYQFVNQTRLFTKQILRTDIINYKLINSALKWHFSILYPFVKVVKICNLSFGNFLAKCFVNLLFYSVPSRIDYY